MKNYEKIADFCNEDPVLFQQAFVAFAGLGAVKMKHLTPAMFDDKTTSPMRTSRKLWRWPS